MTTKRNRQKSTKKRQLHRRFRKGISQVFLLAKHSLGLFEKLQKKFKRNAKNAGFFKHNFRKINLEREKLHQRDLRAGEVAKNGGRVYTATPTLNGWFESVSPFTPLAPFNNHQKRERAPSTPKKTKLYAKSWTIRMHLPLFHYLTLVYATPQSWIKYRKIMVLRGKSRFLLHFLERNLFRSQSFKEHKNWFIV